MRAHQYRWGMISRRVKGYRDHPSGVAQAWIGRATKRREEVGWARTVLEDVLLAKGPKLVQ